MSDALPFSHPVRTADLASRKATRFRLAPDAPARTAIAAAIGVTEVPRLEFWGEIRPDGRRDWRIEAQIAARVEQPCVVTLAPVSTDLSEPVTRRYLADWTMPDEPESEMPEDDSAEPLPPVIDLGAVMVEALSLALPLYPRAPGASFAGTEVTAPDVPPIEDAELRPFAGLADLMRGRDKTEE